MKKSILLYDLSSLETIPWTDQSNYERQYLLPLMKHGVSKYIQNVHTTLNILCVNDLFFPVTINEEQYDNSYVCSPYTAFITYARQELIKLNNKPLQYLLSGLLQGLSVLLKAAKLNRVVCVNNWGLSTNLYPQWLGEEIQSITDYLKIRYPSHVIMFRSLNEESNAELLRSFTNNGYSLFPTRQVYYLNEKCGKYMNKRDIKEDLKLLHKTSYKITPHEDITSLDYPRILELYNQLCLEKYSIHNPQFTLEFIKLCHERKLLTLTGLRNNRGVLDAINGFFERNGVITTPLVGYDTGLPQSLGLYRLLTILVICNTYQRGLSFNMSSGAAHFKRLRGGKPHIEYSALYLNHISRPRRWVWNIIHFLLHTIGVPLLQRYKL